MKGNALIVRSIARGIRAAGSVALAVAITTAAFGPAMAQQKKGDAKGDAKGAAAQPAAAAPAGEQSAWVKLCEKAPVMEKDKDGKDVRAEKSICLTHHERLDGNTGMVLVSAAIRQVEGLDKQHLMIMVPLGMAIQPGLRATVYNKEMWEKAQKNEKVDDAKLSPVKLNFSLCHPAGCTAELELTKELIDQLKGGAGIMVFSINANGQVIAFPVPLTGFAAALDGQPVDNAKYSEARKQLMGQIQQRQQQMAEEYRKQQEQKQATGSNPPAKAPAPPAEKKK